jgi:hypothetical protein
MSNIVIQRNNFDGIAQCAIGFYGGRSDMGATISETKDCYIGYNNIVNFSRDATGECILISNKMTNFTIEHNNCTVGPEGVDAYGIVIGSNEYYYSGRLGAYPTEIIVRYNDIRTIDKAAVFVGGSQATDLYFYYNKYYLQMQEVIILEHHLNFIIMIL